MTYLKSTGIRGTLMYLLVSNEDNTKKKLNEWMCFESY